MTIFEAIKANDIDTVKQYIADGCNINISNEDGDTLLTLACFHNRFEIVKLLIERGSNVNLPNEDKWTPLMYAAHVRALEIVQYLITAGADVNSSTPEPNTKVLNFALHTRPYEDSELREKIIQMLITAGAKE